MAKTTINDKLSLIVTCTEPNKINKLPGSVISFYIRKGIRKKELIHREEFPETPRLRLPIIAGKEPERAIYDDLLSRFVERYAPDEILSFVDKTTTLETYNKMLEEKRKQTAIAKKLSGKPTTPEEKREYRRVYNTEFQRQRRQRIKEETAQK